MEKAINDDTVQACARVEVTPGCTGTAYLVNETWAVTCAHVVDNVKIGQELQLFFQTAPGEAVHWTERRAVLVARDEESDCATLRLTEPLHSVRPLRLAKGCFLDDTWWSFGYPSERGEYGAPCDGRVLLPEGRSRLGKPVIHLYSDNSAAGQGAVIAGASGSPVLVAGQVIGHISRISLGRQEEDAELDHLEKLIDKQFKEEKEKKKALARLDKIRQREHPNRAEGGYIFAAPVRFVRKMLPAELLNRVPTDLLRELLSYLDGLVAEANRLPSYYPPGVRMERVRVRVRVSSERQKFNRALAEERERLRREGIADSEEAFRVYSRPTNHGDSSYDAERGRRKEPSRVQVLDWDRDVRDKLRRGILVGDPGMGKTWLLKWEAGRCAAKAARRLRETGDLTGVILPVYCRVSEMAATLDTPEASRTAVETSSLANAVIEALKLTTSNNLSDELGKLLDERLGAEHGLLLLDAFDEVPDSQRPRLLRALGSWVQNNPKARVLFSSRVAGYQQPWQVPERSEVEREMELLPFDDGQIAAFVHAFYDGDTAAMQDLGELLRRAPQVRGMAQFPLLLGFLCKLYLEQRDKPVGERQDLSRLRRTDLYREVLRGLLAGKWRDAPKVLSDAEVAEKLELLEPVAFRLFLAGKEQFTTREAREALRAAYLELTPGQGLTPPELTRQIVMWSEQDGVLIKAGAGEETPLMFLHLTFQEYLAACHLARRINPDRWDAVVPFDSAGRSVPARDFVDRKAWLPSWQEVIVLLAGNLKDPVPLLELLSDDKKDDVFRHRLALAALCLPEIKELLELA
jgi:predicted NACHT family NTPase